MTTDTDNYNQYFTNFDKAARWPVAVSINRNNSFPLDGNSLFRSYEDAKAYATKDAEYLTEHKLLNNSYVGQIIAVYEPPVIDAETNEEISPVSVKVYKTVPASINPDCLVQIDADTPLATTEQAGIVKLSNSLGTGEATEGTVPTGQAVIDAIYDILEQFDDYKLAAGTGEIVFKESQDKKQLSLNVDSASELLNTFSITTTEHAGQVAIELATKNRTVTVGSTGEDGKVANSDVVTFGDLGSALSNYKTDTLYSADGDGTFEISDTGENLAIKVNKKAIVWGSNNYTMSFDDSSIAVNSIVRFQDLSGEGPITFTLDTENKKGVISANAATTTSKGVVQLAASIDDETSNVVPTAAQVKDAIGKIATDKIVDGTSELTVDGTAKTLTATNVDTVKFGTASVQSKTIKLGTGEGETEINHTGITVDSRTLKFGTGEDESIATIGDIKSKQNRLIDGTGEEVAGKSLIWADGHLATSETISSNDAALMFDEQQGNGAIALSAGTGEISISHTGGINLASDKVVIDAESRFELIAGAGSGETTIDGSSISMSTYSGMDIASESITITSPSITLSTAPIITTAGTADNNVATIGQVNDAIKDLRTQIAGGVRFRCGATIATGTSTDTVTISGVNVTTIQVGDMFTVSSGSITIGESVYNVGDYFIATVASETLTDIPVANFTWIAAQDNDVVKLAVNNILTGDNTFRGVTTFSGETTFVSAPTITTTGTGEKHVATVGQINSAIAAVKEEIAGGTIEVATDRISKGGATLQITEEKKLTTTGFDSISLVAGSRTVTVGATTDGKVADSDVVTQGELTTAIGNIKSDRLSCTYDSGEASIVYSTKHTSATGTFDTLTTPRPLEINAGYNSYKFSGAWYDDSVIRYQDIHCYGPITASMASGEVRFELKQASTLQYGVVTMADNLDDTGSNSVLSASQVKTAIESITGALKGVNKVSADNSTFEEIVNLLNTIAGALGAKEYAAQ